MYLSIKFCVMSLTLELIFKLFLIYWLWYTVIVLSNNGELYKIHSSCCHGDPSSEVHGFSQVCSPKKDSIWVENKLHSNVHVDPSRHKMHLNGTFSVVSRWGWNPLAS